MRNIVFEAEKFKKQNEMCQNNSSDKVLKRKLNFSYLFKSIKNEITRRYIFY